MCYVLFVPALIWSHITLTLGLLGIAGITLPGPFTMLWALSFCLYVAQMWFTLSLERVKPQLYFFSVLSYITYSQIFLFIVFKAAYDMLKNKIQGNSLQWYKTERSKERK